MEIEMRVLVLIIAILLAAFLERAEAHDGHDLTRIQAEAVLLDRKAGEIRIALHLENHRDAAIQMESAYSDVGQVSVDPPLKVAPNGTLDTLLIVTTDSAPGIFTLVLDFGEAGFGPITVFPI